MRNATRSGTLTVAGLASQPGANLSSVSVSGTGLTTGNATVYADGSWAGSGATLADGNNTYTATATDNHGRTASDTLNLSLPATLNFAYDCNGNLTNDGRRVFEYDYENQLTNVYVAGVWRSEFKYDAFGRRRVRQEYAWQSSSWVKTNEVRYVYDGLLTVQERDANNLAMVSYTRGNDLSGTRQGAGGIGGLLARTDHSTLISQPSAAHSYYHCDGNGNVTALVDTNGFIVARYQYDPYGNLLGMSGPLAEANTYRFSSKEWCANAGLYYYGFRFYEPNLQRWINEDPLSDIAGLPVIMATIGADSSEEVQNQTERDSMDKWIGVNRNLFGAFNGNPVNFFDLYGLDACGDLASEKAKLDTLQQKLKEAYNYMNGADPKDKKEWDAVREKIQDWTRQSNQAREKIRTLEKAARWQRIGTGIRTGAKATAAGIGTILTIPLRIPLMLIPAWQYQDQGEGCSA